MKIYRTAFVILLIVICSCKNKKGSNSDKTGETNAFFDSYSEMKLPYEIADTNLKKLADTNTISYPVFTQFVPDTIFNNPFGSDRKITLSPLGKFEQKGKESYFVTRASNKNHSAVYLSVFDKGKFIVSMPLVTSKDDEMVSTASIDKKLSIVINNEWSVKNELFYKRIIYTYNNVGLFTIVLTETNEERNEETAVLNPLDTFPKRYKFSGDYVKGSKNFLSIRDGRKADEYFFFVHFTNDDNDETCGGELKGSLKMNSDKTGIYSGSGDPCVLDFGFTPTGVKVKETGSCGNYRGIKCFFNDTYVKKKEPKAVGKKK